MKRRVGAYLVDVGTALQREAEGQRGELLEEERLPRRYEAVALRLSERVGAGLVRLGYLVGVPVSRGGDE